MRPSPFRLEIGSALLLPRLIIITVTMPGRAISDQLAPRYQAVQAAALDQVSVLGGDQPTSAEVVRAKALSINESGSTEVHWLLNRGYAEFMRQNTP